MVNRRAFLLTLANARLGLWFGNPQSATTWQRSEPNLGVEPIMRELLGLTTDDNPYVYLSDGGHYENLGLWEMVARRCRFIVVSDAIGIGRIGAEPPCAARVWPPRAIPRSPFHACCERRSAVTLPPKPDPMTRTS